MGVTIYGASDDLIEIEGDIREEFNALGGFLAFNDGNVLRIDYTGEGIWRITPTSYGKGEVVIEQAVSSDDDNYSDRATIEGQLKWVVFGEYFVKAEG